MTKKEDLYIAVLNYGKNHIGKPFLFSDLERYLKEKGYAYEEFALRQFFAALFISLESPGGNDQHHPINKNQKFFLEKDGYFHLLEHQELKSARKYSLQATWFAIIAIIISVVSTCFSIYYSNKQLEAASTIRQDQIEQLKSNNLDSILIELKKLRVQNDSSKTK
jgi:hypothetical protein